GWHADRAAHKKDLLAAMDDWLEPVRFAAVSAVAEHMARDDRHPADEDLLRTLRRLASADAVEPAMPGEPSERIRQRAAAALARLDRSGGPHPAPIAGTADSPAPAPVPRAVITSGTSPFPGAFPKRSGTPPGMPPDRPP
ncbi:MAG: hypothetical protein NUV77_20830, partial [Thermoguttaceae bacterium]|nr:hypothetical protein [Thermoguttaceae bacterium]